MTGNGYKFFWKGRKGRKEGSVYVKEKFECMEVSYEDQVSFTKCL